MRRESDGEHAHDHPRARAVTPVIGVSAARMFDSPQSSPACATSIGAEADEQ
jgi:hypothetical protein